MKIPKFLLAALLGFTGLSQAQAQKDTDIYQANYSISFAVMPISIAGTMNNTNSISHPEYKYTDTLDIGMNFNMHIGGNFPLIRTENWSMGAKLHAGVGRQGNIRATEGLESYLLDFPEYVYFRHYGTNIDVSLLAGVKHTRAALDYTLPMIGVDINFGDNCLRFYSSVKRYTYYSLYSNGEERPFLKIGEHGIMCVFRIGGG